MICERMKVRGLTRTTNARTHAHASDGHTKMPAPDENVSKPAEKKASKSNHIMECEKTARPVKQIQSIEE